MVVWGGGGECGGDGGVGVGGGVVAVMIAAFSCCFGKQGKTKNSSKILCHSGTVFYVKSYAKIRRLPFPNINF